MKHGCPKCAYTGYVSGWYLYTIARYPSGAINLQDTRAELIPPIPGQENLYLQTIPDLQAKVDGINQIVQTAARRCECASASVRIPA